MPDAENAASGRETGDRTPRRRHNSKATRDELLAAATEEFAEKGFAGARVEEISARTATSKHMIYYHFGNKEGLYSAVLKRVYDEFRLAEGAIDYSALPPVEALTHLVGTTFDIHATHPQIVRIVMAENINRGATISGIDSFDQRRIALETMRQILERGASDGSLRKGLDPLQIHLTVSALSFHFVANAYTFGHVFGIDAHAPDQLRTRRAEVVETIVRRCSSDAD